MMQKKGNWMRRVNPPTRRVSPPDEDVKAQKESQAQVAEKDRLARMLSQSQGALVIAFICLSSPPFASALQSCPSLHSVTHCLCPVTAALFVLMRPLLLMRMLFLLIFWIPIPTLVFSGPLLYRFSHSSCGDTMLTWLLHDYYMVTAWSLMVTKQLLATRSLHGVLFLPCTMVLYVHTVV